MSDELKPCPFCGGAAKLKCAYVTCCNVGCTAHAWTLSDKVEEVILTWNTRPTEQQQASRIAELETQLKIAREVRHNRDELFKGAIRKRDVQRDTLRAHIEDLESRRSVITESIPQTAGDAIMEGWLSNGEIDGHEWDNRTSEENAIWIIQRLRERVKELEEHKQHMIAVAQCAGFESITDAVVKAGKFQSAAKEMAEALDPLLAQVRHYRKHDDWLLRFHVDQQCVSAEAALAKYRAL